MTRISTSYINTELTSRLQETNVRMAELAFQASSGYRAQKYAEMSADAKELMSLKDTQSNLEQYVRNIETATSRLNAAENGIQGMADLLTEAANLYTLARNENTAETRATLAPQAKALTETFYSLFQTKFDGKYIFSGMASEVTPITSSPTAASTPADPPPTLYYNGDSQRNIVITNAGIAEEYGITGDDLGFARIKAGLEGLWYGLQNNSETDIDASIDMLNAAENDISNMLGNIGGQLSGFQLITERHENSNNFMQDRIDELDKVDASEAITEYAQQKAILESSMLVLSRLNSLSLLDFL